MRELVSRALLSSHLETIEERESAIDRIGALGRASKLGRALWHWKYAGDDSSARSAFKHLLRKAMRRTRIYRHSREFGLLEKICVAVLNEWINPNCHTCGGKGAFVDEERNLKITCATCSGSRLHRYSDRERAMAIGVDAQAYRFIDKRFHTVMLCLHGADGGAAYTVREQLER